MRIIVLETGADEKRLLTDLIHQSFPGATVVETPTAEDLAHTDPDRSGDAANESWGLDQDLRAAALFPLENPNPVLRFARNGKVIFANRASEALLAGWGTSNEGSLPEEWQRIIERALDSGERAHVAVTCGTRVYGLDVVPIVDSGYVNIYGRDVTVQRAEREVLKTIMENTRAQLAYLDPEFNFVTVNSAYAKGSGHSKEELIGRNHFDLFPNQANQAIFERVRDTGQAAEFLARPFEFADQPTRGTTHWDWTLTPVREDNGHVKGLVLSLVDVTDRVRVEQLRDALNNINTSINSMLDLGQIMRRVIAEASAALACDTAMITLREGDRWLVNAVYGLPDTSIGLTFTDAEAPYAVLASERRTVCLVEDVIRDQTVPPGLPAAFGVQSFMTVPLTVRDQVIGTIFFNYSSKVSFKDTDVDFVRKLAASVSLALENARLVDELEQHVQERTAELQAIFDSLPDAVYVGDALGIHRCNQAALDILGCDSLEDLQDQIPNLAAKVQNRDVETGARIPTEQEPFIRAMHGEHAVLEMIQRNLKTGQDVMVRSACAPIVQNGKVTGAIAVNTDITERKHMEEELRRSQSLYQTLQDAVPDLVWSVDDDGRHGHADYVNLRWQQYTGLTLEALNRRGWQSLNHPDDAAALVERWAQARSACQPFEAEFRYRRHDGVYRWFWGRTVPLIDESGQIVKWVGVMTDVDDRKRAEQVLRAHDAELHAYSRRMVDAIENERRSIARELHDEAGQALTSLKVGLGLLQRDLDCPHSFGQRLEDLKLTTDGVLDSLRRLAMDLRPGALDKAGLIPAVRQYIESFRQQTGVDVQFVTIGFDNERLPPEVETNLYRMVQESLTNIARHAQTQDVGIVLERRGARVFLIVEDNGVGFDLSAAQLKGRLGLVGMRERAEMMGGSLHIETSPGRGTTLYVEIGSEG